MIDAHFAILAAVVAVTGSAGYALDTLRGRTEPNRVSWSLWAVAPLIAFAAELSEGVGVKSLLTFSVGFGPALVVIASFLDERAYARVTRVDVACGVLSVAALAMWAITGKGDVAIAFSILSDFFAAIPTLAKARREPGSESPKAFVGGVLGAAITLLTIPGSDWVFASFGFPLYILLIDATLLTLIRRPRAVAGQGRVERRPPGSRYRGRRGRRRDKGRRSAGPCPGVQAPAGLPPGPPAPP